MIFKKIVIIFIILMMISSGEGINNTHSSLVNSEALSKKNSTIVSLEEEFNRQNQEVKHQIEEELDNKIEESKEDEMHSDIEVTDDSLDLPIINEDIEDIDEEVIEEAEKIIEFDLASLQLREGVASDEVYRIREFLKFQTYMDTNGDYYFDSKLKELVRQYQTEKGLKPDGIIGPLTFKAINDDMLLNSMTIKYRELSLPQDIPKGKWILINKTSNTLYHYDNINLIAKYPIASGKTPNHTPEGKFYIVKKFINPYWGGAGRYDPVPGGAPNNPLGKRWLGLSIGGGGSYGIHGNSDPNSIGKYVSLGCIRMFNHHIEELFDIVEYNTPVWIISDSSVED